MTAGGAGSAHASESGGTPKLGVTCHTCGDWGTIVVRQEVGDGVTLERERPCPDHPAETQPEPATAELEASW